MKKLLIKNILLILVLVILNSLNAESIRAQNSINGIIFDSYRKPVAKIEVELLDEFERLLKVSKTTTAGLYFFQGLRGGIYYIQVRIDGTNFRQAKERIQLGQGNRTNPTSGAISGSESIQVNFYLEAAIRAEDQKPLNNEILFAQDIPKEAAKAYQDALKKLSDKKQDEGIKGLENAILIFPDYLLALEKLGYEYIAAGKFEAAEAIFLRACGVNPKSFSAKSGLGIAQYKLGKKAEASKMLEEAIILNPSSANSYLFLGKICRELKEFEKAETNFKKANELSKNKMADAHWELALLYYHNLKRYAEAAEALTLYLKANPKAENRTQIEKLIKDMREMAKEKS